MSSLYKRRGEEERPPRRVDQVPEPPQLLPVPWGVSLPLFPVFVPGAAAHLRPVDVYRAPRVPVPMRLCVPVRLCAVPVAARLL